MYYEETDHLKSVRVLSDSWHDPTCQPELDISNLLTLLRKREKQVSVERKGKGKKRILKNNDVPAELGPRKRTKVTDGAHVRSEEDSPRRFVPAYRRVFNLRYTTRPLDAWDPSYIDDERAADYGWVNNEEKLEGWLRAHAPAEGEPVVVDLGPFSITDDGFVRDSVHHSQWIVTLPSHLSSTQRYPRLREVYDFSSRVSEINDPFDAFRILVHDGRARLDVQLSLLVLPQSASLEEGDFPLVIRVQVDCAYVCPDIFEPFPYDGKANSHQSIVQEAQRRLLVLTHPPKSPLPEGYRDATDIPLLFSILHPAPSMPSTHAHEALQPENLLPTLLPFQRRTVAWMLGREGKTVTETGEIVSKSDASPDTQPLPLFWDEVRISDEEVLFVNRLRGIVSASRPTSEDDQLNEDARGGIIAEEPGLGKTLECISTILMNPAPERSPVNKRWDPEAKINVKEIKTTLIVTPPSLAPQWADELAAHAPTLKVLVYDGWQKVPVPVTEQDVAAEREKRRRQKSKGKAQAAKTKTSQGSKAKAKKSQGSKAKAETKDEDAMDVEAGRSAQNDEEEEVQDWCAYVNTFDVCITTFSVLQHDLGVARAPPKRPRRAYVDYGETSRTRSPLIMCEWYRVIMDEVQMAGGGKTEEMVSLIPRLTSWAVSGTPARSKVADLIHVLKFLRVQTVTDSPRAWTRLQLPGYVREFTQLFQRYAVRTMKEAVKDELTIPLQTRYLVPIDLGRIQRHVYNQTLDAALLDLGLDARGVAATENWEVDVAKLRTWIRKLRAICTHPQVGRLAGRGGADNLHKPGVLQSMAEVLENMREQNWRNYMEDRRNKVAAMATLAQVIQRDEESRNRYREALDLLLEAETEARQLVEDLVGVLAEHAKEGEKLKAETAQRREERRQELGHNANDKGKGKSRSESVELDMDTDDEGLPHNLIGDAHRAKASALQNRLREARIALHKVKFLQGDVYHVLGEQYANQENAAYGAADELRRVLLKSTEDAAERAMTYLDHDPVVKSLNKKDLFVKIPYLGKGGIKSHELIDEANDLIDGLLNEQSTLLWEWRNKLISLLTQPLGARGEDADGQEYTRSLDVQGEAEAYLQAYAALLADRRETLTAERTLLAAHDVREVKARKTKAARGLRYMAEEEVELLDLDQLEHHDVLPEHEVMLKTLNDERKALVEEYERKALLKEYERKALLKEYERKALLKEFDPGRAVKSIMVDLNNIAVAIAREEEPEKIIAKGAVSKLRSLIAEQSKLIDKLQNDLAHLRRAFNERVSYFRQLQEISDTVAEATWEGYLQDVIEDTRKELAEFDAKIIRGRAQQRYMDNLSKSHEEGTVDEDDKTCILCKCDFIRGYITHCAHVFCEDCMKSYLSKPANKTCPVCRVPIDIEQLHRFTVDEKGDETSRLPPKVLNSNEVAPRSRREIHYNVINPQVMQDIQAMEVFGSYGSKIETLLRHLVYLQVADPGAKSIVFSAWADSLLIVQHALQANAISCLRVDQNSGKQNAAKKFRTNPNISVLLLHGERENAGLNVTCASRVFLLESVVHHAFEVQAIARIDRMGQTKPTEVYCYYAEDTVERNILDLAAKQGLSLYTRENAAGTLNITPFAIDADKIKVDAPAKKVQKGDFVYKTEDMLAILFPHLYEDLEYLLPPEELKDQEERTADVQQPSSSHVNAKAGPSRQR
ncbi:hypothetical protein GY45DRAFT_1318648 [Cubamyces sp. BRFM 1775]|nr:hypothetical protein GY45DRAFT_1318648 [Cubamyces sp. BRFM 1775]